MPFYGWIWPEKPNRHQTATDRLLKEGGECLYEWDIVRVRLWSPHMSTGGQESVCATTERWPDPCQSAIQTCKSTHEKWERGAFASFSILRQKYPIGHTAKPTSMTRVWGANRLINVRLQCESTLPATHGQEAQTSIYHASRSPRHPNIRCPLSDVHLAAACLQYMKPNRIRPLERCHPIPQDEMHATPWPRSSHTLLYCSRAVSSVPPPATCRRPPPLHRNWPGQE